MEIFSDEPKNWQDLQNKVAYILQSCGYQVETPKTIQTVRGAVEVDVLAKTDEMTIICECKYWKYKVPQNVIFSFRTIIQVIGANKGIVIAENGFQKGAYENAKHTNIELKTWSEFALQFKNKYLISNIEKLLKIRRKLFRLASDKPEYKAFYDVLNEEQRIEVNKYRNALMKITYIITELYIALEQNGDLDIIYLDDLILRVENQWRAQIPSYSDFFENINHEIRAIVTRIKSIYGIDTLLDY